MNQTLAFLNDLKTNNNRDWFNANKHRYTDALHEFELLVSKLIYNISLFDHSINNLEAKQCIFRIFKDVRFSKNKEPYKTNFGAYICRNGGRKSKFAGYYIHIQPGESFLSGGLYMPESAVLTRIREDIDVYYDDLISIIENPAFKQYFAQLCGDKLKTTPRGYAKNNPAADFLKYKDIYVMHALTDKQVLDSNFIEHSTDIYKQLTPFNNFFNRAIEDM